MNKKKYLKENPAKLLNIMDNNDDKKPQFNQSDVELKLLESCGYITVQLMQCAY